MRAGDAQLDGRRRRARSASRPRSARARRRTAPSGTLVRREREQRRPVPDDRRRGRRGRGTRGTSRRRRAGRSRSCDGRARRSSAPRSPGASSSSERSDSSASTTSHSPAPQPAFEPVERTAPPTRYAGSMPQPRSACTSMLDVVVLPCVPVTAIVGRSRVSSPSSSARCSSRWPRSRATTRSGLSGGIAVETTSSAPAGTFAASWPATGSMPSARSGAAYGEPAARSEPLTVAPSACATSASPLIPAPPMPTKCSLRPAHSLLTACSVDEPPVQPHAAAGVATVAAQSSVGAAEAVAVLAQQSRRIAAVGGPGHRRTRSLDRPTAP